MVYPRDLVSTRLFNKNEAFKVFQDLDNEKIVDVIFECPECSFNGPLSENKEVCSNCGYSYALRKESSVYISVPGILQDKDKKLLEASLTNGQDANKLAHMWFELGGLPYLLIDLVSSQTLQKDMGAVPYSDYLELFREFLKYDVLSQVNQYFILGEIGDAVKIAFHQPEELFKALVILGEKLSVIDYFKDFNKPDSVNFFPRYTASGSILPIPKDTRSGKEINPKDIIVTTLNGSIDINSPKLTELFRLDSGLSFKKTAFEKHSVAAFIFKPLLEKLNIDNYVTKPKKTIKGDIVSAQDEYSVFLFNEKGFELSDDPDQWVVD